MFLLRCFMFLNIVFCYYKQDPIMMGLSGSYNTIAKGYHCVGINPANLAFEEENYIGLFGTNFSLSNNLVTRHRLNDISGTFLDSAKKEEIIGYLNEGPMKINSFINSPIIINFSVNKFAITSQLKYFSNFKLSQDFLKLFLEGNSEVSDGNEDDYIYDLSVENNIAIVWELAFTKAFNFEPLGLGFTIKYLRGLSYYNLEPTQDPYFQTNFTDITSKNTYIMKENSGGEGLSLDFGLTTKRTDSGWKFGVSAINLFGNIKWNKLDYSDTGLLYNEHESYLINLSVNELNFQNLNDPETNDIFDIDANTVYQVNTLPDNIIAMGVEGVDYYCSDEDCISYYIDSENYTMDELDLVKTPTLNMEYPTTLSMGFSKEVNAGKIIVFDLSTGMDTSWGNNQNWRLSSGYIFGTNNIPLRLGLSYGGYDYKSFGFSWGFKGKKEKFNIDFGLSFVDSYNISKTNGFDFGINIYWINKK